MNNIYDIKFKNKAQVDITLAPQKGKVILVVNTASKCGLAPQLEGLEKLHKMYENKGLYVVGFPSNSFKQEQKSTKLATEACKLNYGVTFPMMDIISVNGKQAAPIYKYLKNAKKKRGFKRVFWNFEKFLVDQEGNVVKRYASTVEPSNIEKDIIELLNK